MKRQDTVVVYGLRRPGKSEYRYVGKAPAGLDHRLATHYSSSRFTCADGLRRHGHGNSPRCSCHSKGFGRWVASMTLREFIDSAVVLEEVPRAAASLVELYWMVRLRSEGHRLFNREDSRLRGKVKGHKVRAWLSDVKVMRIRADVAICRAGGRGNLAELQETLSRIVAPLERARRQVARVGVKKKAIRREEVERLLRLAESDRQCGAVYLCDPAVIARKLASGLSRPQGAAPVLLEA